MRRRRRAEGERNGAIEAELDELALLQLATEREAERYRTLFQAAPVAFIATDRFGKIVEANLAASEQLGVPQQYLVGKPLPGYVAPRDRRALRIWMLDLHRRGAPGALRARMQRRAGVSFEAYLSATPADGEIWWVIVDTTAEQQSEERVWALNREIDERVASEVRELQALYDELPVGIAIVDAGSRRVHGRNRRAREILRPWGGELPGVEWLGEDGRLASARLVDRALAGEQTEREVAAVPTPAGAAVVFALRAIPLRGEQGDVAAAVLTFDDVTERERRNRADAQFVDNAAHQLRSPITAIASATAALTAGAKDDPVERERFIAHVARESDRMVRVVDSLLALARLQRGRSGASVELVPLRPLLGDVVGDMRLQPGVEIVVDCADDVGFVGDARLAREAIANVMENAAAHTSAGTIQVTARRDGESTVLDVADSGPGVPPQIRERVFERFFQVESADVPRGAGLGLAIASEATAVNGGTLELLESAPGATFRFTFPGAKLL